MVQASDPARNHLVAALLDAEQQRWLPKLVAEQSPLGEVLYEPGGRITHVHFPTTSIVSLRCLLATGASVETAVVGNEGMVGVALILGGKTSSARAVVQSAGHGFRLEARTLMDEFNRGGPVMHLLLRYTQALITQMAQTVVCNRLHSVDQQLCRSLLLSADRLHSNAFVATQELIANELGVRRESVTAAAVHLKTLGLIRYRRGQIEVLDRDGLEEHACECYSVVRKEYDRLLPERLAA